MMAGSKTVISATMPGRRMPRLFSPTRTAGREVIFANSFFERQQMLCPDILPQNAREEPQPRGVIWIQTTVHPQPWLESLSNADQRGFKACLPHLHS
jgi:hypothetical protein